MIELEINRLNLEKFLKNIRFEDKTELKILLGADYKKEFIEICLNNINTTILLADKNKNPVAIGGVKGYLYDDKKAGQIWLLCSKKAYKHKQFLFKYIKNKLKIYKSEFDILFNYIHKSNFKILLWLKALGFEQVYLKNKDFRFFYYKKEGVNFDIRCFTG